MPVVKAQHAQAVARGAIVLDLADMEREGRRIVEAARQQAQDILARAREQAIREAERLKTEAREGGHAEGLQKGLAEGQQIGHDEAVKQTAEGLRGLVERWSGTLDALQAGMPTHLAEVGRDLVALSVAIARKVTHQAALGSHAVAQDSVAAALELVAAGRTVTVRVHPDEVSVLEAYVPELRAKFRRVAAIDVRGDAAVTPGGCILEYGSGEIDARLETQMDKLAGELLARG